MSDAHVQSDEQDRAPLPICLRADLVAIQQPAGLGSRFAVKDPIALQYYHFQEKEWFLLNELDGKRSFAEIRERFCDQFAPFDLEPNAFTRFVQRAYLDGLVVIDRHGQGSRLIQRAEHQRRQELTTRLMSVLAIRFRGIDPHRILDWLSPLGTILFHPLTLLLTILVAGCAFFTAILNSDVIASRVPSMAWFIQGENLIWMMVALGLVKVLHEFGHGLACRHFGGECHEMGLMFLAFTPCLYCNVSDAWMFPNRWHRIFVSSAGIYVEFILASLCFFGWYFTYPGLMNSILLNVVFICSVNTLFLNGNPLLRYDGYYIATDLFDIPNLSSQSRAAFWGPIRNLIVRKPFQVKQRIRWRLATYALASMIYRLFVVVTIGLFVYTALKSYGFRAVGHLLVGVIVFGLVFPVFVRFKRFLRMPGANQMVHWIRFGSVVVVVGTVVTILLSVPLPTYLRAPAAIEAKDAAHVYAPIDGRVDWSVALGESVDVGASICKIRNVGLEAELLAVEHAIAETQVRIDGMQQLFTQDDSLAIRIEEANVELARLHETKETIERELDRGDIQSLTNGRVIASPSDPIERVGDRELSSRTGSAMDETNQGCFVQRGEWLCIVGSPEDMHIVVYVNQKDIELVQLESDVTIRLNQLPSRLIKAKVAGISREEIQSTPNTLATSGEFNVKQQEQTELKPVETTYRVTLTVDDSLPDLVFGSGGRARIVADRSSLGSRLVRYLSRTLRIDL